MIDQKKTGQFISDIRKEKGLTQKQLADEIGVSDKAISRWETGRGMPDTSIMADLCKVLDISINELLSGQRLSSVDYNGKAEENMVELIKTNENVKRQGRNAVVGTVAGICVVLIGFAVFMHTMSDPATIGPSLAVMVLTTLYACIISLILLMIKGRLHRFHS